MERRFNTGRIITWIIAFILIAIFIFIMFNDNKLQNFISQTSQSSMDERQYEQLITQNIQKVQSSIQNDLDEIVLYSDEYAGNGVLADEMQKTFANELFGRLNNETQKYPRIIGQLLEIPVTNFEVHNENMDTIMTRIGSETVFVAKDFTMPAESEEGVNVYLKTASGSYLQLEIQSYTSLGFVTINGIKGKLSRSHSDEDGIYIFKREEKGSEVNIVSGSKVSFSISEQYRNALPVIFFGNNNYTSVKQFVRYHNDIIKHQLSNDRYIIVCRTPANSELDIAMSENFGLNYIRTDDKIDYKDLSEKIYFRMKTLKYFEIISNSVKKAEKRIFSAE